MCFQTSFGTSRQLVPYVRCASDCLNNRFIRCESDWDLLFFPTFVEPVLLDRTLFSRTSKSVALHRHVALFPVISGPCVLISDDSVSLFRSELRTLSLNLCVHRASNGPQINNITSRFWALCKGDHEIGSRILKVQHACCQNMFAFFTFNMTDFGELCAEKLSPTPEQ